MVVFSYFILKMIFLSEKRDLIVTEGTEQDVFEPGQYLDLTEKGLNFAFSVINFTDKE
jgi:hypothetical protein